jgi:hypothetical protein
MFTVAVFPFTHRTHTFKRLQIYSKFPKLLPTSLQYRYIYIVQYIYRTFCATILQYITVFLSFNKIRFTMLYHLLNIISFMYKTIQPVS